MKICIFLFICLVLLVDVMADPEDCDWVPDHCPVWNGWSRPKCRIDD
jgi:hypothetical protein